MLHHDLESVGSIGNAQKHQLRLKVLCQILLKVSPRSNKNSLFPVHGTCPVPWVIIFLGLLEMSLNKTVIKIRRGKPKHSSKVNASLVLWGSLLMLGQKW